MATNEPLAAEELTPISSINVTPFVDVVLVLLVIFMVTSVDSGALVVDNLAAGGDPETSPAQRILWLILIALVTITLFVIGGDTALKGIQAGAVAMGLPFMVLMLAMMIGFIKALANEPKG